MLLWLYLRADRCHLLAHGETGFIGKSVIRILIRDKTLYLLILLCFGSSVQWEHLSCQPLDTRFWKSEFPQNCSEDDGDHPA